MSTTGDTLHVVTVISNPVRYRSRYNLYKTFRDHMIASGVHLVTVEHAFGNRPFEITSPSNPDDVQLRGANTQEIWIKEALINAGVRRLPLDWKYVAWIDADVTFTRTDWAAETIHALQHYSVVQPWSHSVDIGPTGEVITNEWGIDVDRSFAAAFVAGEARLPTPDDPTYLQHTGFGWAATRAAWDGFGGLMDWVITGAADYFMGLGFAGLRQLEEVAPSEAFNRRLNEFYDRCDNHIKQNLGYVPGTILHGWHGRKQQRGYISRGDILRKSKFDPDKDIAYDWQGIPYLTTDNRALRDGLRQYFRSRNEDSIDAE